MAGINGLGAESGAPGNGGATARDLMYASGLPAIPGSIWSLLAKLSWSDPALVRAHVVPLEVNVQGVFEADGVETTVDAQVVAKHYFLVRRIVGFVERDPQNGSEDEIAAHLTVQLEDQERQFPYFREALTMLPIAGSRARAPMPIEYDDFPMVWLPNARMLATFLPRRGFESGISEVTGLTTRRVGLHLHGALVIERVVDRLLDLHANALLKAGLLGSR